MSLGTAALAIYVVSVSGLTESGGGFYQPIQNLVAETHMNIPVLELK